MFVLIKLILRCKRRGNLNDTNDPRNSSTLSNGLPRPVETMSAFQLIEQLHRDFTEYKKNGIQTKSYCLYKTQSEAEWLREMGESGSGSGIRLDLGLGF